ncbi:MAG: hypothetical protein K0R80_2098 [Clostridia bacterium]|nr:hypothetical protein [Clostridia bacterium]
MNAMINGRLVSYQNDLQRSYMVLKLLEEDVMEEYQTRMIQENSVPQLLPLYKKQIDNDIYIFFDITSKTTLNQLLGRVKLTKHEFLSIFKSLIQSIGIGKQYLLQGGSYILHGDYIYIDPASLEISIAYLPIVSASDVNHEVKALMLDLLVYKASFVSPSEGDFVYELLSMMKSDNFTLQQMDKIIFSFAIGQEQKNRTEVSAPQELVQKGKKAKTVTLNSKANLHYLILILLQLFFAAVAILWMRYSYFQTENVDISTWIGIAIILSALDVLFIKRMKSKDKSSLTIKRMHQKTNKSNSSANFKNVQEIIKKSRNAGALIIDSEEYAAMQEAKAYIDPKSLETSVLIEEAPKRACLIGLGENVQEKIYIDKTSFVIGRIRSQSDYISSNRTVGKLHAEITNKEGVYYIKDLNSRNGTYINGERIVSNVEHSIQNNDRIAFANSEYKFLWS